LTAAAKLLKTTRKTLAEYVNAFPVIQEAVTDIKEGRLDLAENALLTKIKEGNMTAIIFFLKTQGRGRGYSQIDDAVNAVLTEEQRKTLTEISRKLAEANQ